MMKQLKIEIKNGTRCSAAEMELPESWNEVPADLYPYLAAIYLKGAGEMSDADKSVRAFALLSGQQWPVVSLLNEEEIYDLLLLIKWVFEKLDITVNKLPVIRAGGHDYYGPADGLDNIRFAEWCMADTYFVAYSKAKDPESLRRLVACLYRPAGEGSPFKEGTADYRGDQRERFNDQAVSYRSDVFRAIPEIIQKAIYLWFGSCRQQVIGMYPLVFPPGKTGSGESRQDAGWFDIYDDLRGDPRFGGPDKLEDEFLHTVLASVDRSLKKMKELKRKR